MTFTVKIALQPFEVAFEAGSIAEAVAILTEPDNELSKLAALASGTGSEETGQGGEVATAAAPAKKERKKRGAAVEAVAPPPIPVPDAAPPAPPVPAPVDTGIPAFLDRTGTATAVAPPPPMVAPPAPVAPASPPVGVLAAKVAAELKRRGEGAADQGAGLVGWLAGAGLCVPGATFQEAVECVLFLSDEKLGPVATALQITG